MKNYFKNIVLIFAVVFAFSGLCTISAFADNDFEIGYANVNGASINSANVGNKLIHPEIGWNRYDDTNPKIFYDGKWDSFCTSPDVYMGSHTHNFEKPGQIKIRFYGKKIRLLTFKGISFSGADVNIDNTDYGNYTTYTSGTAAGSIIFFQKLDLNEGVHEITITTLGRASFGSKPSGDLFSLDAVDVDGFLLPYEKSFSLNKSLLTLKKDNFEKLTTSLPEYTDLIWSSSDENIATVEEDGKVIGVNEGQATITAQIKGEEVNSKCKVIVYDGDIIPNPDPVITNTLYIEMADTNIKQAKNVDVDDFMNWYKNRYLDQSLLPFYKITNENGETEYIVHDKIISFKVA